MSYSADADERTGGRTLAAVVVCFLLKGTFYCLMLPQWEGYDEWAHHARVQATAVNGVAPGGDEEIPEEITTALRAGPRLRSSAAAAVGTPLLQYEAQQPPLYYTVSAAFYGLLGGLELPLRLLALRLGGLAVAALLLVAVYRAAMVFGWGARYALFAPLIAAAAPGLTIDVARAGNDGLLIVLMAAFALYSIRLLDPESGIFSWQRVAWITGAALLTKASALTLPVALAALTAARVSGAGRRGMQSLVAPGAAWVVVITMAGWWYAVTWARTGSLSGEQVEVVVAGLGLEERIGAIARVDWARVADCAAFSHIWVGGWSFLVARAWMYRVVELMGLLAAAGVVLRLWRGLRSGSEDGRRTALLAGLFSLTCLAVGYNSLNAFLLHGASTALGWYLYGAVAAELVLVLAGFDELLGRRWAAGACAALAILLLALDLYTVHFMLLPYYNGLTALRPSGSLATFRPWEWGFGVAAGQILERWSFARSLPPAVFVGAWACYLLSNAVLAGAAVRVWRGVERAGGARDSLHAAQPGGV